MSQTRFFRHYKNKPYKFIGLVRHSETLEEMALYETLYENTQGCLWVRPKEMFFEKIEKEGKQIYRFEPVQFRAKISVQLTPALLKDIFSIAVHEFPEVNESDFKHRLKDFKDVGIIVIYDNEKAVGFGIGYAKSATEFYSWLGAVLPEYQSLGIASLMICQAEQWCRQQGYLKITTKSENRFSNMIRLNLKQGFSIVGTEATDKNKLKILFEKSIKP